jgi:all-trans-retinol dehydrogenase (NAD+)
MNKLVDYCSSKFAAVGFTDALRIELDRLSANVNTTIVCPYYIDTGMFAGVPQSTRFGFLHMLKPDYVVNEIISAMRYREPMIMLPKAQIQLSLALKALLPVRISDWLYYVFGVVRSMDEFKGRSLN